MKAPRRLGLVAVLALSVTRAAGASPAPALALSPQDRDALTRVAVAEAGNQGESGLAAVVQTVLNRVVAGGWGGDVQHVVDAPHQFESVARAGGDWRRLPAPTTKQRVRIDTILQLMSDGRLPDFIGGALYFQNPKTVAYRVAAGTVAADRLNFGGQTPVVVVGDHAFYRGAPPRPAPAQSAPLAPDDPIFIGPSAQAGKATGQADAPGAAKIIPPASERAMFILSDGGLALDAPHPVKGP